MRIATKIALCLVLVWPLAAQKIVFLGEPTRKIELTVGTADTFNLTSLETKEYQCRIVKDGDNYYWESRGNVEMVKLVSGAFVFYLAVDGSGYIKAWNPEDLALMPKQAKAIVHDEKFDYVEHLPIMLGSINYWGKAAIHRQK